MTRSRGDTAGVGSGEDLEEGRFGLGEAGLELCCEARRKTPVTRVTDTTLGTRGFETSLAPSQPLRPSPCCGQLTASNLGSGEKSPIQVAAGRHTDSRTGFVLSSLRCFAESGRNYLSPWNHQQPLPADQFPSHLPYEAAADSDAIPGEGKEPMMRYDQLLETSFSAINNRFWQLHILIRRSIPPGLICARLKEGNISDFEPVATHRYPTPLQIQTRMKPKLATIMGAFEEETDTQNRSLSRLPTPVPWGPGTLWPPRTRYTYQVALISPALSSCMFVHISQNRGAHSPSIHAVVNAAWLAMVVRYCGPLLSG